MLLPKIILSLSFLIDLGMGSLVYLKANPQRRVNLVFSLLAWASAGWVLSVLMMQFFREGPSMLFWGRMSFAMSGLIPAAFLHFSVIFPKERVPIRVPEAVVIWAPSFVFLFLAFTPLILKAVSSSDWRLQTLYGPVHPFFSIYLLGYIVLGLYFLAKTYRASSGMDRLQLKYCLVGMVITSMFALTTNLILPIFGTSKYSTIGPSFTMIMVGFITYSIVKHRLMDINLVLRKGTTYVFLSVLLFIPAGLLILFGQRFFFQEISLLFTLFMICLLFLATVFFQKTKVQMEKRVEQLLFPKQYDYRETLAKFSKAMVTILDLQSLTKKIIETITQTMEVEKASLYLLHEERGGYQLIESKNLSLSAPSSLSRADALPHYLQKIGEVVVREELTKGAHLPQLKAVADDMLRLEAEVSVPLLSKAQLVGMINLSHKLNKGIYSQEDIDLLTTLANQTTIAVENAKLYEDLKRSKSYIRRADRLASLGTLTAGLAHEIRNPLVAIKTLTQLLPHRIDDEEFRNHFLNIAAGEVDRISSLVNELLEFARPSDPKLEFENINAILDGMVLLVSTETKKKQIRVVKEYMPDLPLLRVDREQIKQVFLNILLNAIDATPENGEIRVKTRAFSKPSGERYVQIEFTDTGCGIPSEYLEDIFTPFFTTKTRGSGLGLSISHQIVQDHKGYIHVESQMNQGASFFINLPVSQEHPKRRKTDFEESPEGLKSFEQR